MPEQNHNELFSVSGMDLTYLVQQQERMGRTGLFRKYLEHQDYKQVAKDVYRHKTGDEVKLFANYGELRYINNHLPEDTGNMIQFIMNRMSANQQVVINNELPNYCRAVERCLDFENDLLKTKRHQKNPRIVREDKSIKRKR